VESVFLYAQKKIALKNQRVNIAQNNRVGVILCPALAGI